MSRAQRITEITLDERTVVRRSPDVEQERKVAIYDLLQQNHFSPVGGLAGPFHVRLGVQENRLVLDIRNPKDEPLGKLSLALGPFRKIIKEYFMISESYYDAIKTASPARIETIDMGRRGLHDDASDLLRKRLKGKVDIDRDTARRLFTLICVLHLRG